jgi:hypothetical protein
VTPLGLVRRAPRPVNVAWRVAGPVAGGALMVAAIALATEDSGSVWLYLFLLGLGVLSLTIGAALVLGAARVAAGRGLVSSMASARLRADVRAPGRIAGVLFGVGVAFGVIGGEAVSIQDGFSLSELTFYYGGLALAGVGACFAIVVAVSSLVVGATEQVLDSRRGVAVLVALAASPDFVVAVVRRQLLLVAVPPVVLGAFLAGCTTYARELVFSGAGVLALPVLLAVAGGAAWLAAVVAARFVRPAVREAAQPESLRAP